MFLRSLTGRFLLLTIVFVMIAEILIFVPSVARFRLDYMQERLERAQIASLSLLASANIDPALEEELLQNAGVFNVVLRRDAIRELILSDRMPMPASISKTYDLRQFKPVKLMYDAMLTLLYSDNEVVRVIGKPVKEAGLEIEITLPEKPLRKAMIDYGQRILTISVIISLFTAALLFFAVQGMMVRPIRKVITSIRQFQATPEDTDAVLEPTSRIDEIYEAERALGSMQSELQTALAQKARLALLGGAVAKISHDLRNMLTTSQLLADRMEMSDDPVVVKTAPKLAGSLSRAINLCEQTLKFGKAEEQAPNLEETDMATLIMQVVDAEKLGFKESGYITISTNLDKIDSINVDSEQIYRVLSNLIRNAGQAITEKKKNAVIEVGLCQTEDTTVVSIRDTGPGLPPKALEHLFKPFEGGVRRGGVGLGLAISAELIAAHQGELNLVDSTSDGTEFELIFPRLVSEI